MIPGFCLFQVLALGIDGWKCDGTDPYLLELVVAKGQGGVVSRAEYSDDYYNDFFDYSRAKLGDNRLIMSRPVDGLVVNWSHSSIFNFYCI